MSTPYRHVSEEPVHVICLKCTCVGTHSLHCPTLRLPAGWAGSSDEGGTR